MAITNAVGINSGSVWKVSNENVSSNATVQNDDELFFTIPSTNPGKYRIYGLLKFNSSSATPNAKFKFTGITGEYSFLRALNKDTNTQTLISIATPFGSTERTITIPAANYVNVEFEITVELTAAATVQLQWSQATSNATATQLQYGSYLQWEKIK